MTSQQPAIILACLHGDVAHTPIKFFAINPLFGPICYNEGSVTNKQTKATPQFDLFGFDWAVGCRINDW
jgi:hypothetical protein